MDAASQFVRKAADSQRPDIGKLRLVIHLAGYHQHRRLQLVECAIEGGSVLDARISTEIGRRHLPLASEHAQDGAGRPTQPPCFFRAPQAPDRVKVRNHPSRNEQRSRASELAVIDVAAPHQIVLQVPGVRGFGIFLYIARHDRVAPPADRDVQRWAGTSCIGQAGSETDALDETLGVERRHDLPCRFAVPPFVAALVGLGGDLHPGHSCVPGFHPLSTTAYR